MKGSVLFSVFVGICVASVVAEEEVAKTSEVANTAEVAKTDDDRKLLLPLLAVKPLIVAGLLAGTKLNISKPGIDVTIIKHEKPAPVPVTLPPPIPPTLPPTFPPQPPTPIPPLPPLGGTTPKPSGCGSLNGFPCYQTPTRCVCVVSTQKPWLDAFNYCRANGQALISIPTAAKQKELEMYLPGILGGQDQIFKLVGFWTSGIYSLTAYTWAAIPEYFTYQDWMVGEPDITNLPRPTCIRSVPSANYKWDDVDCGQFLPFLCEF